MRAFSNDVRSCPPFRKILHWSFPGRTRLNWIRRNRQRHRPNGCGPLAGPTGARHRPPSGGRRRIRRTSLRRSIPWIRRTARSATTRASKASYQWPIHRLTENSLIHEPVLNGTHFARQFTPSASLNLVHFAFPGLTVPREAIISVVELTAPPPQMATTWSTAESIRRTLRSATLVMVLMDYHHRAIHPPFQKRSYHLREHLTSMPIRPT